MQTFEELIRENILLKGIHETHTGAAFDAAAKAVFEGDAKVLMSNARKNELVGKLAGFYNGRINKWYWYLSAVLALVFPVYFLLKSADSSAPKANPLPATNTNRNRRAAGNLLAERSSKVETKDIETTKTSVLQKQREENIFSANSINEKEDFGHQNELKEGVFTVEKNVSIDTIRMVKIKFDPEERPEESIPALTAYDMERNNKEKSRMLKNLLRLSKAEYSSIHGGNFRNKGEAIALKTFAIRNAEVTNLEYKTFLVDLLIQKRVEDYNKAKVHSDQWSKIGLPEMEKKYFYDEEYNYNPVVNISKEGAELYCSWLVEQSAFEVKAQSRSNVTVTDVRLPFEPEWLYAARGSEDSIVYCNGLNTLFNFNGCKLGNFRHISKATLEMMQKRNIILDTTKFIQGRYKYCYNENNFDKLISYKPGTRDYTTPVYSFNPDKNELYCMAGNVSEMVYVSEKRELKTKGGNWNSKPEYLKINASDEFRGKVEPSPFVGFRPVIVFEYKNVLADKNNPFW